MSGSDKPNTAGRLHWAGRKAAQRAFPIKPGTICQRCGKRPATQRHHKDGDTSNNAPGNIELVCQPCMAALDRHRWGWKGAK